ncbi:MAG: ROK family protein [Elusimicrobiota bacterium]|nr:ROK family protein [Elusimicrobiota bacterium]
MSEKFFLGIDMGGTSIKMAVVDSNANIIDIASIPTKIELKPEVVLEQIADSVIKLKSYNKVKTIGFGVAGDIDCEKGILRYAYNLPKWKKTPIKDILQKRLEKKVYIDNDANTAALGAFWLDTKGKSENLICVTLGTGVGGGIIINKKLYKGTSYSAGEIGHLTIKYDGTPCNCGNIGCVEAYLGAKNLAKYAAQYVKEKGSAIIKNLTKGDYLKINPEILYKAAMKKDKTALEIWEYTGKLLGILLANIVNFLNPDTIVLCGGVSGAKRFISKTAKDEMCKRGFKTPVKVCKVIYSKWTGKLGVVGAAMLANQ